MTLVLREELQLECRSTGKTVISEVLNVGADITDNRLDELFEPLVDMVETKAREAIEEELDELRGQQEDRLDEERREEILSNKRANINDKHIVIINGNRCLTENWNKPPNNIKMEYGLDIDRVPESELLEYNSDDSYWDDYRDHYELHCDNKHMAEIYQMILKSKDHEIFKYLETNHLTVWDLDSYLETLSKSGVMVSFFNQFMKTIEMVKKERTCNVVIKAGKRNGMMCNRILRHGKCSYHK